MSESKPITSLKVTKKIGVKHCSKLSERNLIFKNNDISAATIEKNDDLIFKIKKRTAAIKDYRNLIFFGIHGFAQPGNRFARQLVLLEYPPV